jgi:hypothetical protein
MDTHRLFCACFFLQRFFFSTLVALWSLLGGSFAPFLPAPALAQTSRPASIAAPTPPTQKTPASPSTSPTQGALQQTPIRHQTQADPRLLQRNQAMQQTIVETAQHLGEIVQRFALDPKNPWLLAHALLALGSKARLPDQRLILDVLVSENLKREKRGNTEILLFPKGPSTQHIEAHPHLFLQIMSALRIPKERVFTFQGQRITLNDLFNSALYLFPHEPKGKAVSELSWILLAMDHYLPAKLWHWQNAKGEMISLIRTLWQLFYHLDRQTVFLRHFQKRGAKEIPKNRLRNQHIYSEIYGGFYLLRASLAWLHHPMMRSNSKLQALANAQIELLLYRMNGEINLYKRLFEAADKDVGQRFLILMQQIRFLSHALTTLLEAHQRGQWTPTEEDKRTFQQAVHLLCLSVLIIERLGFFHPERLKKMKEINEQGRRFVVDLIADAAHARHALILLQLSPQLYLFSPSARP